MILSCECGSKFNFDETEEKGEIENFDIAIEEDEEVDECTILIRCQKCGKALELHSDKEVEA